MSRPQVRPGEIVVYSDVACVWATIAITRLLRARAQLGLDGVVHLDHRCFPLEDINRAPTPKGLVDVEMPVVAAVEPDLGWRQWQGDPSTWPVTTAPANEAVQAAKLQSRDAAEELDLALRLAFVRDSRCISLRHEILDIAHGCPHVDVDALAEALDEGTARGPMLRDFRAHRDALRGSPHLFLADGHDVHNPGIDLGWVGDQANGHPVVERDDPSAATEVLRRAVRTVTADGWGG